MRKLYQGIDIVEVEKFRKVFDGRKALVNDIFSEAEWALCSSRTDPFIHLAGRFAAKEAALKALGTGMSGTAMNNMFREIEIVMSRSGRPELTLNGWAGRVAHARGIKRSSVSMSHSGSYAVASVILQGAQDAV